LDLDQGLDLVVVGGSWHHVFERPTPWEMLMVNELLDRDLAIYQDWGRGVRKVDLAQKYGLNRNKITEVIERVKADMPPVDRVQVFDQSLEILDQGLAVFIPMMLQGDKGAARIVDRYLGRRDALLGLENPQKLELYQAQNQVQHERVDVRQELAVLLAKIRGGNGHGHA
jgi:hypothetical protein